MTPKRKPKNPYDEKNRDFRARTTGNKASYFVKGMKHINVASRSAYTNLALEAYTKSILPDQA